MWPASGGDDALEVGYTALSSRTVVRTVSAGPASGPPVLLLHGWGCSAFLFRHNLPALASAGYRAIAVDLKGHGCSDKPEGDGEYTLDTMTAHVLEILDALALPEAILIGQSMGARIATEVARRAPTRVRRLVLIAPVGIGEIQALALVRLAASPVLDAVAPRIVSRAVVRLALGIAYGRRGQVSVDAVEGYFAPLQYPEFPRVLQRVLREFTWDPVPAALLAEVRAPTLVVIGSRDVIVRFRRDDPLLSAREHLRVVWIDGAGHAVNEECPDEVNMAIVAFLNEGDRGGSRAAGLAGSKL